MEELKIGVRRARRGVRRQKKIGSSQCDFQEYWSGLESRMWGLTGGDKGSRLVSCVPAEPRGGARERLQKAGQPHPLQDSRLAGGQTETGTKPPKG